MEQLVKKEIKYNYYTVKKINIDTNKDAGFDIREWILFYDEKINSNEVIEENEFMCKIEKNLGFYEYRFYVGQIYRLKPEQKIKKIKEKKDTDVIELQDDEYIGEDMMFLYDLKSKILMVQQNRFSLSVNRLELLFNVDRSNYVISIDEIPDKKVTDKINNRPITKLKCRVNNISDIDVDKKGPLLNTIHQLKGDSVNSYYLELSSRRGKKECLNKELVDRYIEDLASISKNITSARVATYENGKKEVLELFNANEHDFIEYSIGVRGSIIFEEAKDKMIETFKNRYK